MKEIKQIEELDKIVDDYIGINSDNHICECGNRHSVESCKQLQMRNALMNILVTAVDEALATQKNEIRDEVHGLLIPRPLCDCKTHTEHNCGFTSNEAIEDVLKLLTK